MNLKVELIKKVSDVRGLLRSSGQMTDSRITRIKDDRMYLKVKNVLEFEEFSKFGTVELAPVQLGNLLFSEKGGLNPLENTLQDDIQYQEFLQDPTRIIESVEAPMNTLTTPLLEALRDKKSQKSKKSKKELYHPVMASCLKSFNEAQSDSLSKESSLGKSSKKSKKSKKPRKKVNSVQKASLDKS